MYHPSQSIPFQPDTRDHSPLKSPALQLLLSDITAPLSNHIYSTHHDVNHVLQSSEWDFNPECQPSVSAQSLQVDACQTNLALEQYIPVADYISSLLQSVDEEQEGQPNRPASCSYTPFNPSTSLELPSSPDSSECDLSQSPFSAYNKPIPLSQKACLVPRCLIKPVQTPQNQPSSGLTRRTIVRSEWASVPIRQTVVPSFYLPRPEPSSPPSAENSTTSSEMRPKLRFSKGASASKYCHICGRNSKTVSVAQCANVTVGLCRKVVCEKCLMLHRVEIGPACSRPSAQWKCTHCEGVCPKRARCHQYTKNNLRRRMKNDDRQRKKWQELKRKRAEIALEARAREVMRLTRKDSKHQVLPR